MQANSTITNLPVHMAHTHYYDYVDSFPGLKEGPTLDDKHTSNQKILREQLINGQKGLESRNQLHPDQSSFSISISILEIRIFFSSISIDG